MKEEEVGADKYEESICHYCSQGKENYKVNSPHKAAPNNHS